MNNTARDFELYEQPQTIQQPKRQQEPEKQSRVKRVPISRVEGLLLASLGLVTMALMIALVSVKVSITVSQQQLQKVNTSVDTITSKNVDLRQEVGELTSSQRLTEYAQAHGMTLSDNNVRNVTK
ncbi:cell division protein FtsL [Companilactobacillus sp. RD055328]|uniref:cell division protein FtsL n=1 Tax=Companilactobacillus sp. RD055328 TaxID=2916634 RepID=UPI001FC865ED|nr:cell division protein FtsL [Companilactobacillus sp. RD055328]GKQ42853.1 cell division protein FtsL [Companilactobacillus sp. RD055328]